MNPLLNHQTNNNPSSIQETIITQRRMTVKSNIIKRITTCLAALAAIATVTALPARADEEGVEKAPASAIAPIRLPAGAMRSTDEASMAQFEAGLKQVAKNNNGTVAKVEALIWTDGKMAKKELPACLKEAGYAYTAKDTFEAEGAKVTPMAAARKDKKGDLLGMWIEKDGLTLLVWGQYKGDNADKPRKEVLPDNNETPAPAAPAGKTEGGKVPADIVGAWSWTTISGVNYRDTITHQLASPSGMSAKFTFTKDGHYTKFFFISQRTYSLVTESTTTEEGTVTFNDDGTFLVKPAKGYYKGNTGSRIIDRPMTDAERKPITWYWEWRTVDGKKQLYIGPGKASLSPFKRAE
jgi:hypothetical protein